MAAYIVAAGRVLFEEISPGFDQFFNFQRCLTAEVLKWNHHNIIIIRTSVMLVCLLQADGFVLYWGTVGVGGGIRVRSSAAPSAAADLRAPPTTLTRRHTEEASCHSGAHQTAEKEPEEEPDLQRDRQVCHHAATCWLVNTSGFLWKCSDVNNMTCTWRRGGGK